MTNETKRKPNIARFALRLLGIICVLYGAGLFVFHAGAGMIPVWLVLGAVFFGLSFKKWFSFFFSKRWFMVLFLIAAAIIILLAGMICVSGLPAVPDTVCDTIIVLGARVNGETPSLTLQYRLEAAYRYLAANGGTNAILSGGQGADENMSEAEAMRRYLTARSIDENRILLENQSTSTYENLRNSFALIDTQQINIGIVTSDFHILRTTIIAARLGVRVIGIGSSSNILLVPNYYAREMLAIPVEFIKSLFN